MGLGGTAGRVRKLLSDRGYDWRLGVAEDSGATEVTTWHHHYSADTFTLRENPAWADLEHTMSQSRSEHWRSDGPDFWGLVLMAIERHISSFQSRNRVPTSRAAGFRRKRQDAVDAHLEKPLGDDHEMLAFIGRVIPRLKSYGMQARITGTDPKNKSVSVEASFTSTKTGKRVQLTIGFRQGSRRVSADEVVPTVRVNAAQTLFGFDESYDYMKGHDGRLTYMDEHSPERCAFDIAHNYGLADRWGRKTMKDVEQVDEAWSLRDLPFFGSRARATARRSQPWYERLAESIGPLGWTLVAGDKFQARYRASINVQPGGSDADTLFMTRPGQMLTISVVIGEGGGRRHSARTYVGQAGAEFVYGRGLVRGNAIVLESDEDLDMADLKSFIAERASGREFGKLMSWADALRRALAPLLDSAPDEFRVYQRASSLGKASVEFMSGGMRIGKKSVSTAEPVSDVAAKLAAAARAKLGEGRVLRSVMRPLEEDLLRRQDAMSELRAHAAAHGLQIIFTSTTASTFSWFTAVLAHPGSLKEVAVFWNEPAGSPSRMAPMLPALRGVPVSEGWTWHGMAGAHQGLPLPEDVADDGYEMFSIDREKLRVPTLGDHAIRAVGGSRPAGEP